MPNYTNIMQAINEAKRLHNLKIVSVDRLNNVATLYNDNLGLVTFGLDNCGKYAAFKGINPYTYQLNVLFYIN